MLKDIKGFFEQVIEEFKKIKWPTRNQAIRLTIYVIGASLIVGLLVSVFDYVFKELLKFIVA